MDPRPMEKLTSDIIQALKERGLVLPDTAIDVDTPLVSSGLIDSFGLVEVLAVLESASGLSIPSGRVSPQDLDTVGSMIKVAAKWGKKEH